MNYLKYLWITDLRKLNVKNKLIAIFIYNYIPAILFFKLMFWTAFKVNIWQVFLVTGFMLGWLLKGHISVLEYAFKNKSLEG